MNAGWNRAWSAPGERLLVESRVESDFVRHRFRSNEPGDGAVLVCVDEERVLFIEVHRPAVGLTLVELPRGQAEARDGGPVATAVREAWEETGYRITRAEDLGRIWPDSGLCGDGVHVVRVLAFDPPAAHGPAPEFATHLWLSPAQIRDAISSGRLRDAISLGALALVQAQEDPCGERVR